MPDFFDVVLTQRAARAFLPDDVDDETVARILTAATHAPSAENSQPFVFIVVRDAAVRAAIGVLTERLWHGGARAHEEQRLSPAFLRDVHDGATGGVAGAPVLVVVCGDTRLTHPNAMDASGVSAVQNLLLAAHALGLGSTLTTLPVLGGDELSAHLGLPPEVVPVAVIPLGFCPSPSGHPGGNRSTRRHTWTATGTRSPRRDGPNAGGGAGPDTRVRSRGRVTRCSNTTSMST